MVGAWSGMVSVTGFVRPDICTATSVRGPGAASFAMVTGISHQTMPSLGSLAFIAPIVMPVDGVISMDRTGLARPPPIARVSTVVWPSGTCVG